MRRLDDISVEARDRWQPSREPPAPRRAKSAEAPRMAARPRTPRRLPLILARRTRRILTGAVLAATVIALPSWLFLTGIGHELIEETRSEVLAFTARHGYGVQEVFVEGRARTAPQDLLAALAVKRGDPILGLDLAAARARLETLTWVGSASLERRLPGEIHLVITERVPTALWQSQGRYFLVDRTGRVIDAPPNDEDIASLFLIVGDGAPEQARALLAMLDGEPSIKPRVKAAQRISERRWNLRLDDATHGIVVRLPEEDPEAALAELARLDREEGLLSREVALIDMRLPDRLVLRATPGVEPVASGARRGANGRTGRIPGRDA